jgi:hypothetical protein
LFNLTLRQALDRAQSLLKLAGLDWQVLISALSADPRASAGGDRGISNKAGVAPAGSTTPAFEC